MPIATLKALPAAQFDYWKAQHLLNRAGFGGTPSQVRALANMGLDRAVEHIVEYDQVEYEAVTGDTFDGDIMRPRSPEEQRTVRRARQSGDEKALEQFRRDRQKRQRADRQQVASMQRWWLRRMIESPRPLEEKMALFWHGHFATAYRAIEDSYHMFLQNQFFRANATGSFANLVHGIVRDPAMIRYLNNDRNRRQAPNENLARELMELFVLGEGNAYTERDIKEGARALTGNTFKDDAFQFRASWHDAGAKSILGKTGNWDGADFCDIILSQRISSEFICWKLYRFFVNDLPGTPPVHAQQLIKRMATKLRDGRYALNPVLKSLFRSAHFYEPENIASQIKSPTQLVVQAIRSLGTPSRDLRVLLQAIDLMGQSLFYPPSVKGWDGGRAWVNTSTLFVRQNVMIYLLTGRMPEGGRRRADPAVFDARHLIEHLTTGADRPDPDDVVRYLLRLCFGTEPHEDRVQTLMSYIEQRDRVITNSALLGLLSLITAMPEYQLC